MKLTMEDKAYLAEKYRTVWEDEGMVEHSVKGTSAYIALDDGKVITFGKPTIQTDFWFGEHGYDFDEKNELCHELSNDERYFIEENLSRCDAVRMLESIEAGNEVRVCQTYSGSDICHLRFYHYWDVIEGRELDQGELEKNHRHSQ